MATLAAVLVVVGCAGHTSSSRWPPPEPAVLKNVWVIRHGWHTRVAVALADVDPSVWPESRDLGDVGYLEVGW